MLNRIKDRIRGKLSVSLCELGNAECHQLATLGIATVARDATSCRSVLEVARKMAETLGDAWLTEVSGEVIALGREGRGLRGGLEAFGTGGIVDSEEAENGEDAPHSGEELLDCAVCSEDSKPIPPRPTSTSGRGYQVKRLRKK